MTTHQIDGMIRDISASITHEDSLFLQGLMKIQDLQGDELSCLLTKREEENKQIALQHINTPTQIYDCFIDTINTTSN